MSQRSVNLVQSYCRKHRLSHLTAQDKQEAAAQLDRGQSVAVVQRRLCDWNSDSRLESLADSLTASRIDAQHY